MDQFLKGASHLLKIFAIFPGLANVKDKWQNVQQKDNTKIKIEPKWTVDKFCNKKQDKPSDKNPLQKN